MADVTSPKRDTIRSKLLKLCRFDRASRYQWPPQTKIDWIFGSKLHFLCIIVLITGLIGESVIFFLIHIAGGDGEGSSFLLLPILLMIMFPTFVIISVSPVLIFAGVIIDIIRLKFLWTLYSVIRLCELYVFLVAKIFLFFYLLNQLERTLHDADFDNNLSILVLVQTFYLFPGIAFIYIFF